MSCRKRVFEITRQVMLSNATRRALFQPTDTHLYSVCPCTRLYMCTRTLFHPFLWLCRLHHFCTEPICKGCSLWQITRYIFVLYPQLVTLICYICRFDHFMCYTGLHMWPRDDFANREKQYKGQNCEHNKVGRIVDVKIAHKRRNRRPDCRQWNTAGWFNGICMHTLVYRYLLDNTYILII